MIVSICSYAPLSGGDKSPHTALNHLSQLSIFSNFSDLRLWIFRLEVLVVWIQRMSSVTKVKNVMFSGTVFNFLADYPAGVWLGEENNPELRVRVSITPSDLLHIHSNCRTPEKMALTLLDYLFDRDTQAISNLSGTGKHGKKQLDPLKIYGIRCK